MRKSHLIAISVALSTFFLLGTVALAGWVENFYAWHSYNAAHSWGNAQIQQSAAWDQYWDNGQSRYTNYRIKTSGSGAVSVASDSSNPIKEEYVTLQDYQAATYSS